MSDSWTNLPDGGWGPEVPYILDVLQAKFGINPTDQNNPDQVRLKLTGRTDDEDWKEFTLELRVEREVWEIINGGEAIRHKNPGKKKEKYPSLKTGYGRFAGSIIRNANDNNRLGELLDVLRKRGTVNQAEVWHGLRLVIGKERDTFTDNSGQQRAYYPAVIVGFEGLIDDETLASANKEAEEIVAQQREKLTEIAQESDSHAAFANKALSDLEPEITDQDLLNEVMDKGREGFYEKVQAGAGK